MTRKYNIASSVSLMNMSFSFADPETKESHTVSAAIDFLNKRVYFHGEPIEGVDYDLLQEDILSYLVPDEVEVPAIPESLLGQIREARDGKRQEKMFKHKD